MKSFVSKWSEEVFFKKLKARFRGHMLLMILMVKKLLEGFTKINRKNQIKKSLELKKQ